MPHLICVGDRTSHGGTVTTGSSCTTTHGRAIARVGDTVTCPIKGHGGTTCIVSGDPTLLIDGAPAARHGDRTACGAVLLSSQAVTWDESGTSNASHAGVDTASGDSNPGDETGPTQGTFDQCFEVIDPDTGKPLAHTPYRIQRPDGSTLIGRTDANGLTERVAGASPATITLEIPFYGDISSSLDTDRGCDACRC